MIGSDQYRLDTNLIRYSTPKKQIIPTQRYVRVCISISTTNSHLQKIPSKCDHGCFQIPLTFKVRCYKNSSTLKLFRTMLGEFCSPFTALERGLTARKGCYTTITPGRVITFPSSKRLWSSSPTACIFSKSCDFQAEKDGIRRSVCFNVEFFLCEFFFMASYPGRWSDVSNAIPSDGIYFSWWFLAGNLWFSLQNSSNFLGPTGIGVCPPLLVAHVGPTFQSLEIREKTRVDITAHRSPRLECRSASFDQEMNQIIPG